MEGSGRVQDVFCRELMGGIEGGDGRNGETKNKPQIVAYATGQMFNHVRGAVEDLSRVWS